MNELLTLVIQFQDKVYWQLPFLEWADMRKFRAEATDWRESDFANRDQNARHLDATAEGCRQRAIQMGTGRLLAIENGLRQHAPELLPLVPIVDFAGDEPADFTPWQKAMKEIEAKLRQKIQGAPAAVAGGSGKRPKRDIDWWLEKLTEYESAWADDSSLTETTFAKSIGEKPNTVSKMFRTARAELDKRKEQQKQIRDNRS